ncbi:hypothetical protein K7432_004757 [Basidiobolus ranarum]|uniref:Cyanocobalamin reductase (cyanide-eliminating) n=1 Tax=Basidiobolus ranarum TaxID=34480 RepID=A0ABR2W451_9FUNG
MTIKLMKSSVEHVISSLSSSLMKYGLDLVLPFSVTKYNSLAIEHNFQPLPLPSKENSLGLLIGNTKYLWPYFIDYLSEKTEDFWEHKDNPLDDYIANYLQIAVERSLGEKKTEIRFSHVHTGDNFIAIQHAGRLAGLQYDPDLGFCLHPTYGPWIGLRGVVIVGDVESLTADSCSPEQISMIPSETLRKLELEMTTLRAQWKQDSQWTWEKYWTQWVSLRDRVGEACSTQQWRYCDEQIRYHYLKDLSALKVAVENSRNIADSKN